MIGENTTSLPYQSGRARVQHTKRIFLRVPLTQNKKGIAKKKKNGLFFPLHAQLGCVCLSCCTNFHWGGPIVFDVVRTQDVGRQRQQPPATAGHHRYGSNVVVRPTAPLANNNVAHHQPSREQTSIQRQHFRNPVRGRPTTELQQHKRMVVSGQRRPVIANQLSVLTPSLSHS